MAPPLPPNLDAARASRALARADARLRQVVSRAGPCPLAAEPRFDPFQALCSAIAHQQLHGKAAQTILGRFQERVGGGRWPTPEAVRAARPQVLRSVGFSQAKALALKDLASKRLDGTVPSGAALARLSDDEVVERLTQVRGVGAWTAQMVLIFRLGRLDVLPVDDFGVRKGFTLLHRRSAMVAPKELLAHGERWRPYRSVAAWYLWRVLDA